MLITIFGIFLIGHGLVHLLYAGQSWRLFELRPGMTWPDGSWLFTKFLRNESTRLLACICLVLAALGFAAGGLGLLCRWDWWRYSTVFSSAFSALTFLMFWNGQFQAVDDQGGVGVLINLAILFVILVLNWPT